MHNLETVLSFPREAMYLGLGDYLTARIDSVGLRNLTPVERTLWLSREFDWSVREGGLLGYMVFDTGKNARDAEVALRTIGAVHTANLLRDAIPAHEQFADAFYEACGRLWDEVDDLPALICDYARANREFLLGGSGGH